MTTSVSTAMRSGRIYARAIYGAGGSARKWHLFMREELAPKDRHPAGSD